MNCTSRMTGVRMPSLPQLAGGWFLTDGGIETALIFQDGIDLPEFAAFTLLSRAEGPQQLRRYYRRYLAVAANTPGAGFILESPTWRAGDDWGARLGFDRSSMERINADAVMLMHALRGEWAERIAGPIVVSGCIGPRGDGYVAGQTMQPEDARRAHQPQVDALAAAGVDFISAITMTTSAEAIGINRGAARAGRPTVISFTLETDGRLPSGEELAVAIDAVDNDAAAEGHDPPAYYMLNCAHPEHLENAFKGLGARRWRIRGVRANASRLSHAELDAATELDDGNPEELAADYRRLLTALPALNVLGGCCGTDERHVARMSELARPS